MVGIHNKKMLEEYNKSVLDAFILNDQAEKLHLPAVSAVPFVILKSTTQSTAKKIHWPFTMSARLLHLPFWGTLRVRLPSLMLGVKEDVYVKTCISPPNVTDDHYVAFVEKNKKPHCMTWKTDAKKLRQAVRWGIVPAESVTGKVINALGHYRVVAHERIIKGLISNTHRFKIALLDHYQDRVEALQEIESLVNKNNIPTLKSDYQRAFKAYIKKLRALQENIDSNIDEKTAQRLREDIAGDIQYAQRYYDEIVIASQAEGDADLKEFNRARGNGSVEEFVKRQLTYNLYEMQGINQDYTYNKDRAFALTRGAMNDCIVNAMTTVDGHQADPRNLVLPAHHGIFGSDDSLKMYNFQKDHLSPEREREVLLAISFIEGWDKVVYNQQGKPELHLPWRNQNPKLDIEQEVQMTAQSMKVTDEKNIDLIRKEVTRCYAKIAQTDNPNSYRALTETAATNWRTSQNLITLFKKIGMVLWNAIQSILVRTQSWDENPWPEKTETGKYLFKPFAVELRKSSYLKTYSKRDPWYTKLKKLIIGKGSNYTGARPNDPLWLKALQFLKMLGSMFLDVLSGGYEAGKDLLSKMPADIYYDWKATEPLPDVTKVIGEANQQIGAIKNDFSLFLNGYQVCFMPLKDQPLEKHKFYVKKVDDKLYYKVLDPSGNPVSGEIPINLITADTSFELPPAKDPEGLQKLFRPLMPLILDITSRRNHTQLCLGVNEFIRSTRDGDEDLYRPLSLNPNKMYPPNAEYTHLPYHLTSGEWDDLANSVVRGVDGFASFFTHGFAKDPIGAAAFGAAYSLVGGSILLPKMFSFMGPAFMGWAQGLGSSVASGGVSSAVAGAAIVGQWGMGVVDVIEHGPQSGLAKTVNLVLENPLSLGLGVGAGWLAGHLLTISIPVLHHDLGTNEHIGKLTFGGKGAVMLYEAFQKAHQNPGKPIKFVVDDQELEVSVKALSEQERQLAKEQADKARFASWLAENHNMLPMLDDVKHQLLRHIEQIFSKEQAAALKKLLFPEEVQRIIVQAIKVPAEYISLSIRFVVALFTSAAAFSPEPLKRAGKALGEKILKDLARLVVMTETIIRLLAKVTIMFKVLAYAITMPITRLLALAGIEANHSIHQFFAMCHVALRKVGEFLYDIFATRAVKHVVDEHPCSVLLRQQGAYQSLLEKMGVTHASANELSRECYASRHVNSLADSEEVVANIPAHLAGSSLILSDEEMDEKNSPKI